MLCSNTHHAIFFDGPDLLLSVATSDCSGSRWGHSRTIRPMEWIRWAGVPLCMNAVAVVVPGGVPRSPIKSPATAVFDRIGGGKRWCVRPDLLPAALAERPQGVGSPEPLTWEHLARNGE